MLIFKRVIFALIIALTLYIGNVYNFSPKKGGRPTPPTPPPPPHTPPPPPPPPPTYAPGNIKESGQHHNLEFQLPSLQLAEPLTNPDPVLYPYRACQLFRFHVVFFSVASFLTCHLWSLDLSYGVHNALPTSVSVRRAPQGEKGSVWYTVRMRGDRCGQKVSVCPESERTELH